jgi:hypothetical protein
VLVFFAMTLPALFVIAVFSPGIFAVTLGPLGNHPAALPAFLILLTLFLAGVAYGVLCRWRWIFWLLVVAFIGGVLRVPASFLELSGAIPRQAPDWYLAVQAGIGLVQLAIGLLLVRGYRKGGAWGAF